MAHEYFNISREQIDKEDIFKKTQNTKHFVAIYNNLQTLKFDVNMECDKSGDFLVHIAARGGLSYLPLMMTLVKSHGADIELTNGQGMTPLMLAAADGNSDLCDVLICLFQADTNKPNPKTGRTALHYAAERKHRKTVECLILRGADVNLEDHGGLRADDILTPLGDDCQEVIVFNRTKRMDMLTELVFRQEILSSQISPSDLCVVDGNGKTLIMTVAVYNKFQTLQYLLEVSTLTIDAQHRLSGMTAVAMAARLGNLEAVQVLLRHKACPVIVDMDGYLPLHHAVMNNHTHVVDAFFSHFPSTYTGLYKAMQLSVSATIHDRLKSAWKRRQEKIVMPKLLECAVNGQAEELYRLLEEGDSITQERGTSWPICLAVENGHLEVLRLLQEHRKDVVSTHHPITSDSLLHVATKMGHLDIVSYLLQFCRSSQRNLRPVDQTSTQTGHKAKPYHCKINLESVLDINTMDKHDQTALHIAVERGFSHIVKLLLSHGASTSVVDREGKLLTCPQYEGIQVALETHRRQHTLQIMTCIEDGSRKAQCVLRKLWLPRFDHHLRNSTGSTPLMVASRTGNIAVIKFLLESAVYPETAQFDCERDKCDSESDTDSGVLDLTSGSPPQDCSNVLYEIERSLNSVVASTDLHESKQDNFSLSPQKHGNYLPDVSWFLQRKLASSDNCTRRPQCRTIYHRGLVSHVRAVNLKDGSNVLHYALHNSDVPQIIGLFLQHDPTLVNMQDDRGETALHLACKWEERNARPDANLNICTFDGSTVEDLTTSKAIKKMLEKSKSIYARQL
ncbi:unnamed protein product, partial [Candidula unifasciata]